MFNAGSTRAKNKIPSLSGGVVTPHREGDVYLTEERAILDAPPAHIDLEAFRFYLRRLGFVTMHGPQPDSVDDLRNRDVLVEIGGELRATLYGILAFGRDPQRYARTRDFRIECVTYMGNDRASDPELWVSSSLPASE